jgi:hypothetical protein
MSAPVQQADRDARHLGPRAAGAGDDGPGPGPQSLADVLKLRGESYYQPLATAARALCTYELYGDILLPPYAAAPTVQQASRTLERNPELRDSVAFAFNHRRPWMPATFMACLHFLFAHRRSRSGRRLRVKKLYGEARRLEAGSPILRAARAAHQRAHRAATR